MLTWANVARSAGWATPRFWLRRACHTGNLTPLPVIQQVPICVSGRPPPGRGRSSMLLTSVSARCPSIAAHTRPRILSSARGLDELRTVFLPHQLGEVGPFVQRLQIHFSQADPFSTKPI